MAENDVADFGAAKRERARRELEANALSFGMSIVDLENGEVSKLEIYGLGAFDEEFPYARVSAALAKAALQVSLIGGQLPKVTDTSLPVAIAFVQADGKARTLIGNQFFAKEENRGWLLRAVEAIRSAFALALDTLPK